MENGKMKDGKWKMENEKWKMGPTERECLLLDPPYNDWHLLRPRAVAFPRTRARLSDIFRESLLDSRYVESATQRLGGLPQPRRSLVRETQFVKTCAGD